MNKDTKRPKQSSASVQARSSAALDDALLVELVTELAALLMAAGISATEFEKASKRGFVTAAGRIARLGNSRINRSAVAAMTGLSRSEVKRLSENSSELEPSNRSRQRALRVLDGWQTDQDFLDPFGSPRMLGLPPKSLEFRALVRRYSGDIPPRAILRELVRLEIVEVSADSVRIKRLDPNGRAVRQLQTVAVTLAPILARIAAASASQTRLLGRELTLVVPDQKAHRLLHKQLNEAVKSFFLNLQSAAEGASLPRKTKRANPKRTQISILISAE